MEFRESYPTVTDARQLGHVGFSRKQIAGLERVKALYQRGAYHEATPEYKRQAREDRSGKCHGIRAILCVYRRRLTRGDSSSR